MIPTAIDAYLRARYRAYEHRTHAPVGTAQALAAAEHVSGYRVAKTVALTFEGGLALAVVAAADRLQLHVLEEATGSRAELVPEPRLVELSPPCELGALPPLALFGVPIFTDDAFLRAWQIVMAAGTRVDAIALETGEWAWCERVQPITGLGRSASGRHRVLAPRSAERVPPGERRS